MAATSSAGRARIIVYVIVLLCNFIVFTLAATVNSYHGFFYVADQMPFAMSVVTFLIIGPVVMLDTCASGSWLSKPIFELLWLGLLTIFWLAFNAFSSSRWRFIQASDCAGLPDTTDLASTATWCKEVQALRSFVWIEWLILAATLVLLARWTFTQARRGNQHVWGTPLPRYAPRPPMQIVQRPEDAFGPGRESNFLPVQPPAMEQRYPAPSTWQHQQHPAQQYPFQQYAAPQQHSHSPRPSEQPMDYYFAAN